MPDVSRLPTPARDTAPARLAELADLLGGESSRSKRFLGGLVVGALAGAALAGASLLTRRRGPDEDEAAPTAPPLR
jgi:hypothetical protein